MQDRERTLRAALRLVGLLLFVYGCMATVGAFLVYLQTQEEFTGMRVVDSAGVYGILHALVPLVTGALLFKMAALLAALVLDDPAEEETVEQRRERIRSQVRDAGRGDAAEPGA